ncbi:hypothetical protein N0V95_006370 [Ascochyta clinopodiicola]|nr:hypothetical protein N0V95_006370 [Ascochyta clinopodiicola]
MKVFSSFYAFADRFNRPIHITQALLVLGAFITGCALMANTSMPRSRSTTLVLVYSIKSALFLLYQYLSTHAARFRRFASLKANYILDQLDCLLATYFVTAIGINWPKWRASKKVPQMEQV